MIVEIHLQQKSQFFYNKVEILCLKYENKITKENSILFYKRKAYPNSVKAYSCDSGMTFVNEIEDKKLSEFVAGLLFEHEKEFKITPAAKLMHHNYIGGLMVHTIECVQFAEHNLKMFMMKLNRDIMIAACILHDIGKIFEYTIDLETGIVDYDENFRSEWISHSQYGFSLCMMNGFKRIAKMIAAHHGREDWGAMIDLDQKDLEPELYFLHFMDNLSAKFGKISVSDL